MNDEPRPPRVLLVLNDLRMGGSERQALWLAGALRHRGYDAGIVGLGPTGVLAEQCLQAGIPCHSRPLAFPWSRYYAPYYLLLVGFRLRRLRPDLVSAFTSVPNVYCSLVWRRCGVKACVWNQRDEGIGRLCPAFESRAVQSASGFIANSRASAAFLTDVLHVARTKLQMVPNAIWTCGDNADPAGVRRLLGLDAADTVVTMVGNIRPPKDHATLLHAWRILVGREEVRGRRPILLLVGRQDSGAAQVQSMAGELGLTDSVRFLGYRADVQDILSASDIGVFSSRSEGMPNGVLECMARGLPVAATNIPGVRDCLPDEQHSFLAAPGDPSSLADCLHPMLVNVSLRRDLGKRNRRHVERENAPDRVFSRYLDALVSFWPGMRSVRATAFP